MSEKGEVGLGMQPGGRTTKRSTVVVHCPEEMWDNEGIHPLQNSQLF